MAQSAFIKFVEGSSVASMTLEEVQERLHHYQEQLALTGKQLDWEYDDAGFPYSFETKPEGKDRWFYLKGTNPLYKYILFGIGTDDGPEPARNFIQVVLPDGSTHGDKAKANELCKHLGKQLQAELHLFNGRVMYYNPRK